LIPPSISSSFPSDDSPAYSDHKSSSNEECYNAKTQVSLDSQIIPVTEPQERPVNNVDNKENVKPADNSYNFPVVKAGIDEDIEREPVIQILLDKFNGKLLQ